jgi:2-amino-4-hydroxy-6-hydroxymethyldihydropteridine diphosphokinase
MPKIYLLLGSNLGDRETYLKKSRKLLAREIGAIERSSGLYETASWGKTDQPDFINQVVEITSDMEPRKVLEKILAIEKELGRVREEKWGSRTIDIDVLFYGDKIINEPDLIIPHPFLQQRRFALEPLMELDPELEHPLLKRSVKQLLTNLTDTLSVSLLKH